MEEEIILLTGFGFIFCFRVSRHNSYLDMKFYMLERKYKLSIDIFSLSSQKCVQRKLDIVGNDIIT